MIANSKGWPYRISDPAFQIRDKAMVSLLYIGGLRISEALRITKKQFTEKDPEKVIISSVLVSKKQYQRGRSILRSVWLPKQGERAVFTELIMKWVDMIPDPEKRLFPFKRARAWQITTAMTGKWVHYFRALGEAYLYDAWGNDILAVADYVNVTPSILTQYIRGAHRKKKAV